MSEHASPDGSAYRNPSSLAERLARARQEAQQSSAENEQLAAVPERPVLDNFDEDVLNREAVLVPSTSETEGPQTEVVKTPERTEKELKAHEVLSGFQTYKTDVREGVAESVTAIQRKVAKAKNLASAPKALYLEVKRDAAQEKYDRISAMQDQSKFEFINRRRDRKAAAAYDKLSARQGSVDKHDAKMSGRLEAVDQAGTERLNAIEQRREELVKDKIAATERKLIREEQRERRQALKNERSLSHTEREQKVKAFSKEDMKRIRLTAVKILEGNSNYVSA